MKIIVRKAKPSEYVRLARLISGDKAWTRYGIDFDKALHMIENAEDEFYVAIKDEKIIGFCAWRPKGMGNFGAYLRMIIVAETFRNKGIGKQLLDYVWNLTIQGSPNLFLICSTENTKAQKFYEREGFSPVGILDDLVVNGRSEILYRKTKGLLNVN